VLCTTIKDALMSDQKNKNYPNNILQSIGIAGILILGLLVFIPIYLMLNKLISKEASALIYYLLVTGGSLFVISLIRRKRTGQYLFNLSVENTRIIPFIIIITIFLYFGIVSPISASIQLLLNSKETALNTENQIGIFNFIRFIIASPILEELIFSGIILDGLLKRYNPIKSILVTSLLFGLIHLSPTQFISGFSMGIFTGWIYYKTKSVTFSIIIHVITNLTALLMNYLKIYDSLKNNILFENTSSIIKTIITILGSVLITIICFYFLKNEFNKKDKMAAHNK
jgi:uncharacterized protein